MKDSLMKSRAAVGHVSGPKEITPERSKLPNTLTARESKFAFVRGALMEAAMGSRDRPCLDHQRDRSHPTASPINWPGMEFKILDPETGPKSRRRRYLCLARHEIKGLLAHGYGATPERAKEIARTELAAVWRTEAYAARRAALKVITGGAR